MLADFFSILLDRADTTRRYYREQGVGLSIWLHGSSFS